MKVAVVGAGIFGITVALKINSFCDVTIFEKNECILSSSSRGNQLRIHRGYHYPRAQKTVDSLLDSQESFLDFYGSFVLNKFSHFYGIAKENSKTSAKDFELFCSKNSLEYNLCDGIGLIDKNNLEAFYNVNECLLDFHAIKIFFENQIKSNPKIKLMLNTRFKKENISDFDFVINCTYSDINELKQQKRNYKFEVCEKILVALPPAYQEKSIVILDGPFMCVDPYGQTGMSLLGNVKHAIHHKNIGTLKDVPDHLRDYLDKGIISDFPHTKFDEFVSSGIKYIPFLKNAKYKGSMLTVRIVLAGVEKTDERPTIVTLDNDSNLISVFSGKIDTCVEAANEVKKILLGESNGI